MGHIQLVRLVFYLMFYEKDNVPSWIKLNFFFGAVIFIYFIIIIFKYIYIYIYIYFIDNAQYDIQLSINLYLCMFQSDYNYKEENRINK